MQAFKERWANVSFDSPCAICGKPDQCSRSLDSPTAVCYRVGGTQERKAADGRSFWIHSLSAAEVAAPLPAFFPRKEPGPAELLDRVYRKILGFLSLASVDRDHLVRVRRLPANVIAGYGFASWPDNFQDRAAAAARAHEMFGADLAAVPGLITLDGRPSLAGRSGLAIPVRNLAGQIVGIRIRDREPDAQVRYTWLSSRRHGGASPVPLPFVALIDGQQHAEQVRVVEGEFKALTSAHLAEPPVASVSVPGVGLWQKALPLLRNMGASRVIVAFDQDQHTNPSVGRAVVACLRHLKTLDYTVIVEDWPRHLKGFDDAVLAALRSEVA